MLNQDFKEFIESLTVSGVRYLVVGGYAMALHGHPRYTKDLDVWIDATPENSERMVAALDSFGFASMGLRADDFMVPDRVIQLGFPPNRIDLLTSLVGVSFTECFAACEHADVDGVNVAYIDVESLKRNKRTAGRLQDLADVEKLEGGE